MLQHLYSRSRKMLVIILPLVHFKQLDMSSGSAPDEAAPSQQSSLTPDFASILTMPPAYGDVDRLRPPPIIPPRELEGLFHATQSDRDSGSLSPPASMTIAFNGDSSSTLTSPGIGAHTLTPMTSIGSPSPRNISFLSSKLCKMF